MKSRMTASSSGSTLRLWRPEVSARTEAARSQLAQLVRTRFRPDRQGIYWDRLQEKPGAPVRWDAAKRYGPGGRAILIINTSVRRVGPKFHRLDRALMKLSE